MIEFVRLFDKQVWHTREQMSTLWLYRGVVSSTWCVEVLLTTVKRFNQIEPLKEPSNFCPEGRNPERKRRVYPRGTDFWRV